VKALVIYDSTYGHTAQIAQAIGEAAGAEVVRPGEVAPAVLAEFDLLIVGSPSGELLQRPAAVPSDPAQARKSRFLGPLPRWG
jgi:menaquinone-dependent protoporphyrinogen IX oxidase